jgi:predicted nucleic acid-binding protein
MAISSCLVDTNILLRVTKRADPQYKLIDSALEWRRIIVKHNVAGVQVHDARLAAAMIVHDIHHVLTLNVTDFSRYGIKAMHPTEV